MDAKQAVDHAAKDPEGEALSQRKKNIRKANRQQIKQNNFLSQL